MCLKANSDRGQLQLQESDQQGEQWPSVLQTYRRHGGGAALIDTRGILVSTEILTSK